MSGALALAPSRPLLTPRQQALRDIESFSRGGPCSCSLFVINERTGSPECVACGERRRVYVRS